MPLPDGLRHSRILRQEPVPLTAGGLRFAIFYTERQTTWPEIDKHGQYIVAMLAAGVSKATIWQRLRDEGGLTASASHSGDVPHRRPTRRT